MVFGASDQIKVKGKISYHNYMYIDEYDVQRQWNCLYSVTNFCALINYHNAKFVNHSGTRRFLCLQHYRFNLKK